MTTTFQDYILNKIHDKNIQILDSVTSIGTVDGSGSGSTSAVEIIANNKIRLLQGIGTFTVPNCLALSLIVQRGSGQINTNDGIVPITRGFNLELQFRALNYFYPSFTIELLTSDAEIFLEYELQPTLN